VEATGGTAAALDSFDPLGRVTRSRQVTNSQSYRFGDDSNPGYEYLRNGALSRQRNPGSRVLSWTYDDAGRPTGVGDGTTNYATAVTYTDHGAVDTMQLNGQRIREKLTYDASRLQLTGIALATCSDNTVACSSPNALWTAGYSYSTGATAGNFGGPDNNGNPRTQDITVPGMAATARQSYSYDGWNRLKTFSEGPVGGSAALSDTYCFDNHGNRAVVTRAGLSPMTPQVATCSAANVGTIFPGNKISGSSYDVGGALGSDGRSQFRYNAEDLVAQSWPARGTATVTSYEYDGENRRVAMVTNGARTTFVYDASGALTQEYGGTVQLAGTSYLHGDALGSTRVVTDAAGGVARRMDYWPFGEEIYGGQTSYRTAGLKYAGDNEPLVKFTGKERDAETGLDYFGARYLSAAQGRFTSPDAPFADQHPEDPQSWNMYGYVRNNPLAHVDTDGRACFSLNSGSAFCGRATEYGQIDARVSGQTRFFAAASAVSQFLANTDIPFGSRIAISGSTKDFLSTLGTDLQKMNSGIAGSIQNGSLSGEGLDPRIVHMEQTKVQGSLDQLKKSDPAAYRKVVEDSNTALNPTGLMRTAATTLDTDKAYMKVLDGVRKDLGRNINFSKQSDREAIGNALIQHIRQTGGCDVAGDRLQGCR
jgi:RHS repeat-associated protein